MWLEVSDTAASTMRFATPLIFAALGGILCERAGIVNIALEGLLLIGAFSAVYGSYVTGSPWAGLGLAVLASAAGALLHAVMTIRFGANQIISGTAINLLALGGTGYLLVLLYGKPGSSPQVEGFHPSTVPGLAQIPVIGPAIFSQSWFVWAAPLLAVALAWAVARTTIGLRLRASGEAPRVLEAAGVSVLPIRYAAVGASGVLCGVGGAYLSLSLLNAFSENMTAGRGFIALAAVIFGGWRPIPALGAAVFFGFANALVIRLPHQSVDPQFLHMIPYVATTIALVVFSGGSNAPASVGANYRPGEGT